MCNRIQSHRAMHATGNTDILCESLTEFKAPCTGANNIEHNCSKHEAMPVTTHANKQQCRYANKTLHFPVF